MGKKDPELFLRNNIPVVFSKDLATTYANNCPSDIGLAKEMELCDLHITTNYYKWPNNFKDLENKISGFIAGLDKATKDIYQNYNDVFEVHIFTLKRIDKTYTVNDFTG